MRIKNLITIITATVVVLVIGIILGVFLAKNVIYTPSSSNDLDIETTLLGNTSLSAESRIEPERCDDADCQVSASCCAYGIARAEAEAADRAEADRQAKEEAAKKAREEAAKKPAIERISVAKVQSMMQTYLSNGNIAIFRTLQYADKNPHIRCHYSEIKRVSDLLDYKNITGDVNFSVTGLEYNDNKQVTYIELRIN